MFDLRKIEAFCKVCEHRSFSKAGEALFLSQPTVSAHIQSLERDFDVRLLDRMGRTVLPTPAGVVLYRYARQAIARLEAASAEIKALSQEVAGDLILGSSSIPAHHVLPEALASFASLHPTVKPSLSVGASSAISKQVLRGELMGGIVGSCQTSDPDLITHTVLESEIIIIVPAAMPKLPTTKGVIRATRGDGPPLPEISFESAASLTWILREESSATRRIFEESLRLSGYDVRLLRPRLVVDSSHAAVQYVRAGLGVSVAARIAVESELERGEIRAYTLCGVRPHRSFSWITNARRMPFPAAAVFQEFLLENTRHLRQQEGVTSLAADREG